ncbi:MAG TPA: TetR/AcrR family transcriptional regulator [Vicinamibacterales bacterium]|nr:TetR/AcrR family transcriptional regulator [Vicinamibacterales bacterium]
MTKDLDIHQAPSAERILSTALDLFAVKGYDATAVREICEAAGITKPTLYHFYGSKDGVFQALVRTGFLEYRAMVDAALSAPGSFRQRAKVLARSMFESASTKPRFWRFMHGVIWAPPGTALPPTEPCTQFYDGVVEALSMAADEAVKQGELAAGPTAIRMLILMGAISEAATGYVIAGKPELTPELADHMVDVIVDGWKI